MTPQVLTVLAGTSGVIGLLAVISYFYYSYRIREIESSERSIRQVVEGEGLFNSDQILQILREFKDDPTRLEALKTFANINNQTAERVYSKIKSNVDLVQLGTQTAKSRRQLSLWTAAVFVIIGLVALVYQLVSRSGTPDDGRPSPSPSATVVVTPTPLLTPAVVVTPDAPQDAKALINSALSASNDLQDFINADPTKFHRLILQSPQLVKLYFKTVNDFEQRPNDPGVLKFYYSQKANLTSLAGGLPYVFEYIAKVQKVRQQVEALSQVSSLGTTDQMLLKDQADQIKRHEQNQVIVSSVITNPEPAAVEEKRPLFNGTFNDVPMEVLGANFQLLRQLSR
jgi:hypothetical protein